MSLFVEVSVVCAGSMCYTIMGASTAWPSPTLVEMADNQTPVVLDTVGISWMVSLMFVGHLVSPVPSGYLMDILGRKRTCLYLAVFPIASWLLILFAKNAAMLYLARFFAGVWIGIHTTVMPIYVAEISGPKLRNSLTTINNLLLNFGVLFVYVVGPYVSYYTLAIACELLTVFYIVLYIPMPESPYYYIKRGQVDQALESLKWLRKGEPEEAIHNEVKRIQTAIENQQRQRGNIIEIFSDVGNRKAFFIAIAYSIIKRSSGSGVLQAYTSITLPNLTFGVLDPDTCVIIIGVISFLSAMLSTALMVKVRRRTLLTISGLGCGVSTLAVMVYFFLRDDTSVDVTDWSDVLFVSFAVYYSVFSIGLGPVGTSIKGEIFSPNVKALSSSMTTMVVAATGFVMNKFYLLIRDSVGMYVNYAIFSASCFLAVLFTWTYVPDTQNKTLEEIREILRFGIKPKKNNSNL